MIQKILFCIGLTVLIVSGSFAATITVSGGTGLQAAIDSANPGDTVEVTDSLTYAEDVLVNKDDLVLVCTAIDPATIEAQNNTLRGDLGQLIADLGALDIHDEHGGTERVHHRAEILGRHLDDAGLAARRINQRKVQLSCRL